MKRGLFIFISLFILIGCIDTGFQIVDYYYVYDYADYDMKGNPVHAENVLMCKLSSKNDPFIEDVVNVQWNDSTIIAKTDKGYFVIEANSYGLCCCCGNKTIGPLNESEIKNYTIETGFKSIRERSIR